jgi:ParB-like chromosome segregation protein Spo0J
MRVIDGMHRVRAAILRGDETVEVEFFDGDDNSAFVLAVEANVTHGLPLSLADREAAAARIVEAYPDWSDRSIAKSAGLSADTVGVIRRRATVDLRQLHTATRIGRDGRKRPVDIAAGRQRASEYIAGKPDASLREIARAAGIAVGTARDVRIRVQRGEDPVPKGRRGAVSTLRRSATEIPAAPSQADQATGRDLGFVLHQLKQDPALRFTDSGRTLLRWLDVMYIASIDEPRRMLDAVPPHCAEMIAELARGFADTLQQVAQRIASVEGH